MTAEPINFLSPMLTLAQASGRLLPVNVAYWLAIALIGAGCLVIAIVLVFLFRSRRAAARGFDPAAASPHVAEDRSEPMTDEAQLLLRLMGDAEDLCHRLGSELDAKADRVERLLARLDGRLGSAEAAAGRTNPSSPLPPSPVHIASSLTPTQPLSPSPEPLPDAARPEIVTRPIGVPTAAVSVGSPTDSGRRSGPADSVDPLASQIYKLADAGLGSGEIARTLRQHAGKVELILALRGR